MALAALGYVVLALAAGMAWHLSTAHQHWWPEARAHAGRWRLAAVLGGVACLALAILALGTWPGVFAALTALMLVTVLLPWVDAWHRLRAARIHVE